MTEAEQAIISLDVLLDQEIAENLRRSGVQGLIPVEMSLKELVAIATSKGLSVMSEPNYRLISNPERLLQEFGHVLGVYTVVVARKPEMCLEVGLVVKKTKEREEVYICDDGLNDFKEVFGLDDNT